jgi:hypothetical protein
MKKPLIDPLLKKGHAHANPNSTKAQRKSWKQKSSKYGWLLDATDEELELADKIVRDK